MAPDRRRILAHRVKVKDRVEGMVELGVAVVEEEAELLGALGQRHRQVARLLCGPRPGRVRRYAGEVHAFAVRTLEGDSVRSRRWSSPTMRR